MSTARSTKPKAGAAKRPGPGRRSRRLSPFTLVIAGVVVLGVVAVAIAAFGGSDDGDDGVAAFGEPRVAGDPLPAYSPTRDAAVGTEAPVITGTDGGGGRVVVGGTSDGPTLVVFLAHWCPHCRAEVPRIVDLVDAGDLPADTRLVAVLTGTDASAPNYPPVAWLEREGWPGDMLLDDADATAAQAYGLSGYPFLVVLDEDGTVVARASGEQPAGAIRAMVEKAAG